MGATAALVVGVGAELVGAIGKGVFEQESLKAQQEVLRTQALQERVRAAQNTVVRQKQLENTLATAEATAVGRGVSLASPTFKTIQRGSFDAFNEDQQAAALNLQLRENVIKQKLRQTRLAEDANIFDTTFRIGEDIFGGVRLFDEQGQLKKAGGEE